MGENLEKAISNILKKHGAGSVMKDGDRVEEERISTGSLGLDIITGGGYPLGRFVEVYAPESSGKTTVAIHGMIEAQKKYPEKKVVFIDAEHAFDIDYAEAIGLDVENFIISQPDNGESGLEIASELIDSGEVSMVVIDSIAALTPKKEIEGEI